jgi:hypothetical protein
MTPPAVLASTPFACTVCHGRRRVLIVAFPGLAMHGGGTARCPHCTPEPGRGALPLYLYPLFTDRPRGDDAA